MNLDADRRVDADDQVETCTRVTHDVRHELRRQQQRNVDVDIVFVEVGAHEPPRETATLAGSGGSVIDSILPPARGFGAGTRNGRCGNGGCAGGGPGIRPAMQRKDADVADAIDDMVAVLEATCAESDAAARQATALRQRNGSRGPKGRSEAFDGTALVRSVSALQQRLSEAASRLRRAQAKRLRDDGLSTERIAELFGVTRQRISALLRVDDTRARKGSRPRS